MFSPRDKNCEKWIFEIVKNSFLLFFFGNILPNDVQKNLWSRSGSFSDTSTQGGKRSTGNTLRREVLDGIKMGRETFFAGKVNLPK